MCRSMLRIPNIVSSPGSSIHWVYPIIKNITSNNMSSKQTPKGLTYTWQELNKNISNREIQARRRVRFNYKTPKFNKSNLKARNQLIDHHTIKTLLCSFFTITGNLIARVNNLNSPLLIRQNTRLHYFTKFSAFIKYLISTYTYCYPCSLTTFFPFYLTTFYLLLP